MLAPARQDTFVLAKFVLPVPSIVPRFLLRETSTLITSESR